MHPESSCVSLAPVSQTMIACKQLKVKHLKLHFKFHKVFHRPVENLVENPKIRVKKGR